MRIASLAVVKRNKKFARSFPRSWKAARDGIAPSTIVFAGLKVTDVRCVRKFAAYPFRLAAILLGMLAVLFMGIESLIERGEWDAS